MEYVQLGKTDLMVSRICFGCWQLSPAFWGDVAIDPWQDAVRAALDVGVNFIDTADAYGEGLAESELGQLLAADRLRDRFIVATKFYWRFTNGERFPDTTYGHIIDACEASLRRLKTDRIDLYQIHAFDPLTRPDDVAAALLELKRQGKIRWIGVSNLNPEQMRMYAKNFDVSCLQPPYSALNRAVEAEELPYCLSERIGVIVYSPLFRGLLTGKYKRDHVFTDSRARAPQFSGEKFHRVLDALDTLRPVAETYGLDLAQLAIRWVLTHPAVTSAIVGVKERRHIEGIVPAVGTPLSGDDWHRVARVLADAAR
ncbi:MAG: aldo/keto reductase [Spirochaetaceae bacterium]|nr:MAG: aldo/keto reductase [Spirochaetaceae bacterium]